MYIKSRIMEPETKGLMKNLLVGDLLPDLDKYCVESNNPKAYIVYEVNSRGLTMEENIEGIFLSFKDAVMRLLCKYRTKDKHKWDKGRWIYGREWSYNGIFANTYHIREVRLNEELQSSGIYYTIHSETVKKCAFPPCSINYLNEMIAQGKAFAPDYKMEMFEEFRCFDFNKFAHVHPISYSVPVLNHGPTGPA